MNNDTYPKNALGFLSEMAIHGKISEYQASENAKLIGKSLNAMVRKGELVAYPSANRGVVYVVSDDLLEYIARHAPIDMLRYLRNYYGRNQNTAIAIIKAELAIREKYIK